MVEKEAPWQRGDEVWNVSDHNSYGGHYNDTNRITIAHGLVVGGGEHQVIIQWDGIHQLDRRSHGHARFARTREYAIARMAHKLDRMTDINMTEAVAIIRLKRKLEALRNA